MPASSTNSPRTDRQLAAILDNVRSLYNVGSMFRTADAFGFEHLYLCGMTGTPADELTRSRIAKTSLGAEQSVRWTHVTLGADAAAHLKAAGFEIVALEQTPDAIPIQQFHPTAAKLALVVGHELYGIRTDALAAADHHVMIPMLGTKESLNVAVAFGVAAAQLRFG